MKIIQRNKLSMYIVVLQFLAKNTAIWSILIAFGDAVTLLTSKVAALQQQVGIQTTQIVGYAIAKKGKKKDLVDRIIIITGVLQAYAVVINDDVLFAFAKYTKSKLMKQADNLLTETANNILAKATQLGAALAPYGIDATVLLAFQALIADYVSFVESPRLARVARKTATANIKSLIKEIDKILKTETDLLMVQFLAANPDFFNGYKGARIIIDIGHHHLPIILAGTVNSGQILNVINSSNPRWVAGITVIIKNTTAVGGASGMYFYVADNAADGYSGQGSLLLPGQEEKHTLTAAEFKTFMNIQNQGADAGTFEVTIL